jgi:uncharacterized protein (DUF1810 family)
MNDLIYCFDSAEEAIQFLSYHILDKRTETILTTVITTLQRENSRLRKEIEEIKFVSQLPDILE